MSTCALCSGWIVPCGVSIGYTGKVCGCPYPQPAPTNPAQGLQPKGLPEPPSLVKLVTPRDNHQQNVIETLRKLLADAEAGEIVALTGIAEYRTHYQEVNSGCRNVYSMVGAHMVAATKLANGG